MIGRARCLHLRTNRLFGHAGRALRRVLEQWDRKTAGRLLKALYNRPVLKMIHWPLWAIAGAAALLRGLFIFGIELYSDEAYYWLWSRRPAAGYFDHPPMVAWLARLSSAILPGEIGVRLLFLLCGGLAVLFAGLTAREVSDDPRAPLFAALLAAGAPLLTLTGALALPDAPVEAAYAAGTWLLLRARGPRWIAAGVAVGLALLSKYNAALLAPALVLLVFWDRELRQQLRRPWPWAGGAVAVAIFAPCLIWNARHDFLSIRFQLRHGFSGHSDLRTIVEFVTSQLLGAGPVVLLLGIGFLLRPRDSAARRLSAATLFPLAVTVGSAIRGHVEANWPVLVYPGLCAAAGAALVRWRPQPARVLVWGSVAFGALAAALYGIEVRHPFLLAPELPVIERFHGWRDFAQRARDAADRSCAALGSPPGCTGASAVVFPVSYQVAGELAFYGGFRRFGSAYERPSQLDLWNDQPAPGEAFLYIGGRDPPAPGPSRYQADRAGPTVPFEARFRGAVMREGSVTAYSGFVRAIPWPVATGTATP